MIRKTDTEAEKLIYKLPAITFLFWTIKMCATTLGETGGDLLSMTLDLGYALSVMIILALFLVTVFIQLKSKKYQPVIYWAVILESCILGTNISDFMNRTLGLGYLNGSLVLIALLTVTLALWWKTEKSLSVTGIKSMRAEAFYWTAILFSNTLGTSLGDFLSDYSGLGFSGAALLVAGLLLLITLAYYFTKISTIALFWFAFVLTRPFGATFGDLLTFDHDEGGLNMGTVGSSLLLFVILALLVTVAVIREKSNARQSKKENLEDIIA